MCSHGNSYYAFCDSDWSAALQASNRIFLHMHGNMIGYTLGVLPFDWLKIDQGLYNMICHCLLFLLLPIHSYIAVSPPLRSIIMCPLVKAQGVAKPGSVYCSPLLTKNGDFLQEGLV